MLLDARTLAPGTVLRAQTCIVGAGAAGITVARELAASGRDVLLVESGGVEPDPPTQALHEAKMTGRQWGPEDAPLAVTTTRLRYLGGTTNHWAGYCRPLQPVDLEVRPGIDRSGWPITYEELDGFYPRAGEVLGLVSPHFDPPHWSEAVGHGPPLLDAGDVRTVVFQLSPVGFNVTYRDELEASDQITVLLHANVTGFRTDESGRRVTTVDLRTLEGRSSTVEPQVVVVAAGGIETPRLLLASNERGGIGNDRDLVGRFFCEHFQNTLGFAVLSLPPSQLRAYQRQSYPVGGADATVQSVLVLSDDAIRSNELLGLEAQLLPMPFPGDDVPVALEGPAMADLAAMLPSTTGAEAGSVALVQVNAEQTLNPSSRIRLGRDLDAIGVPLTEVHWAHTELDRSSILSGLRLLGRELGQRGLGRLQVTAGSVRLGGDGGGLLSRLQVDPGDTDPLGFHLAHGNHHMCSTRMADDPSAGVVDRHCLVHGTDNLFVAGSAVFATPGVAAPTITLVALAIRLADRLHQRVLP